LQEKLNYFLLIIMNLNIAISGPKGCGKSSLLRQFVRKYIQQDVPDDNLTICLETNHGGVIINVYTNPIPSQFKKFDGGIILFDSNNVEEIMNHPEYYEAFQNRCEHTILCATKVLKNRKQSALIEMQGVLRIKDTEVNYHMVSVDENYNTNLPFVGLLNQIFEETVILNMYFCSKKETTYVYRFLEKIGILHRVLMVEALNILECVKHVLDNFSRYHSMFVHFRKITGYPYDDYNSCCRKLMEAPELFFNILPFGVERDGTSWMVEISTNY